MFHFVFSNCLSLKLSMTLIYHLFLVLSFFYVRPATTKLTSKVKILIYPDIIHEPAILYFSIDCFLLEDIDKIIFIFQHSLTV
jgi:hypothetical protein